MKRRQEEKGQREGVKVRRGEIYLFCFFPQEREMERKAGGRGV